jgi:hypothetical protein
MGNRRQRNRYRPGVESFEGRCLTAASVFAGATAGPPVQVVGARDLTGVVLDAKWSVSDAVRRAIAVAERELGYHEGPGADQNKFSAYFHRGAEPWCADFVSYCFEKAGAPLGRRGVGFARVGDMVNWFRQHHAWDSRPEVGAVIALDWHPGVLTTYDHAGIVTRVTATQITFISGNYLDRVAVATIPRGSAQIIGYGHRS